MHVTLEEVIKRIEALEARIRQFEAEPKQVTHYHYAPPVIPAQPAYDPYRWVPPIPATCFQL